MIDLQYMKGVFVDMKKANNKKFYNLLIFNLLISLLISVFSVNIFAAGMDDIKVVGGRNDQLTESLSKLKRNKRNYCVYNFLGIDDDYDSSLDQFHDTIRYQLSRRQPLQCMSDCDGFQGGFECESSEYLGEKYNIGFLFNADWIPSIIIEKSDLKKLTKTNLDSDWYLDDIPDILKNQTELIRNTFGEKYNRALEQVQKYIDSLDIKLINQLNIEGKKRINYRNIKGERYDTLIMNHPDQEGVIVKYIFCDYTPAWSLYDNAQEKYPDATEFPGYRLGHEKEFWAKMKEMYPDAPASKEEYEEENDPAASGFKEYKEENDLDASGSEEDYEENDLDESALTSKKAPK